MASGLTSTAPRRDENDDPFRLGWRYVKETAPDGSVVTRQVPLTERDVLHPQEDDFIVTNDAHVRDMLYLFGAFDTALVHMPTRRVFCDHRVDFGVEGIEPFGPDIVIFEPVPEWDGNRGTFYAAEFAAEPLLVIEVTSPSTRQNDVGIKVDLYERCFVPLYVIIDRQNGDDGTTITMWAYQLGPNGYETIEVDEQGRLWLEPVKLWLGIVDGKAACFDVTGRRDLPRADLDRQVVEMTARLAEEADARRAADERIAAMGEALNLSDEKHRAEVRKRQEAEQARQEAEQARQEAEQARQGAEQARQGAEQARQGAEQAQREAEQRAETEAQGRQQAEAALRALEEEIRRLKGP